MVGLLLIHLFRLINYIKMMGLDITMKNKCFFILNDVMYNAVLKIKSIYLYFHSCFVTGY